MKNDEIARKPANKGLVPVTISSHTITVELKSYLIGGKTELKFVMKRMNYSALISIFLQSNPPLNT